MFPCEDGDDKHDRSLRINGLMGGFQPAVCSQTAVTEG